MRARLQLLPVPLREIPQYFVRPLELFHSYRMENVRADLVASITVSVVALPQAIAFSLIAGLPAEMGLYAGVVGAVVGALWGSSAFNNTGPTSALSLLVLSGLAATITPGTTEFVLAAGLMAVLAGLMQMAMGLARLGMLVNFVSDAVIVGFSAGAGVQIAVGELRHLLGLDFTSRSIVSTLGNVATHLPDTHAPTLLLGVGTLVLVLVLQKLKPQLPGALLALIVASLVLVGLQLDEAGVRVLGELPSSLPPLAPLPIFDLDLISDISTSALAVAAIGLIQTMAVARSLASQTGERLDSNQEFVGQGLANIAAGLFSGFPVSGSFSRSAVNFRSGARTSFATIFAGLVMLLAMLTLAPLGVFLPRAALSGVLILVAYGMVNRVEMLRLWHGARGDALIMLVTLFGTILLPIHFAVLSGVLLSLGYYIMQTSAPRVLEVMPDETFKHLVPQPQKTSCPQLGIMDILGDLYFGAVNHVEDAIRGYKDTHPTQRFLLLRMRGVHRCDISGINMLQSVLRAYRKEGGDVYMTQVREPVMGLMRATGFYERMGADHFLPEEGAIEYLFYNVLDAAVCIYESDVRVFRECQNLPRPDYPVQLIFPSAILIEGIKSVEPRDLWEQARSATPPNILDVREPREWKRGHIPQAQLQPFSSFFSKNGAFSQVALPLDEPVVLVCRAGRRSERVAALLRQRGYAHVSVLEGGMLAWEAAGLLSAVE